MFFYLFIIIARILTNTFHDYQSYLIPSIIVGIVTGLLTFVEFKITGLSINAMLNITQIAKKRFFYSVISAVIFTIGNRMLFDWLNISS